MFGAKWIQIKSILWHVTNRFQNAGSSPFAAPIFQAYIEVASAAVKALHEEARQEDRRLVADWVANWENKLPLHLKQ